MAGRNGKKTAEETSVHSEVPLAQAVTTEEPISDTNGNGEHKPVKTFSYLVYPDTYVQAAIWPKTVQKQDGSTFLTYEISLRKRYRDSRDREWKSMQSFRPSELYAVAHAVKMAEAWVLETRNNG